jgi:hypothetical protein
MFGAPVGVFVAVESRMLHAQWVDLGIYLQSLMLLATGKGLATCAQGFWRNYSDFVSRHLALPQGYQIAFGMALGYEDSAAPINQWRSTGPSLGTGARCAGSNEPCLDAGEGSRLMLLLAWQEGEAEAQGIEAGLHAGSPAASSMPAAYFHRAHLLSSLVVKTWSPGRVLSTLK